MLIAMMMPSALPVFRSLKQLTPRLIDQIGFIFPYWLIWSSFAFVLGWKPFAHPGHSMNSYAFPWLLWQGIILVGAGIFQFTPLKQSCLEGCRSAVSMLLTYYDQSIRSMVGLGIRYAVNCLGCCWALMAVMLVAGMNNIVLMVALTFVMSVERQWKHGKLFSLIIGGLLIVAGAALLALPLYKQVIA
jgi:predicted metal-binding membrane protein